jgi:hypothetical protein
MSDSPETSDPNREIEELLPWHLSGRLGPPDSERVDEALAADARLRRSKAAAAEEMAAAIEANAALPGASKRMRERLMAHIEQESPARSPVLEPAGAWARLRDWARANLSGRALAYAGMAAALLIAVQAAVIGDLLTRPAPQTYQTASQGAATPGATVLVEFAGAAPISDIARFLDQNGMTVVEGPGPGQLWKIRIGPAAMPQAEIDSAIAKLKAQKALVRLVLPGPKP